MKQDEQIKNGKFSFLSDKLIFILVGTAAVLSLISFGYSKYVTEGSGQDSAQAAAWALSIEASGEQTELSIGPNPDTAEYSFVVKNFENTAVSEVSIGYVIILNIPKEAKDLSYNLKKGSESCVSSASEDGLTFTFTDQNGSPFVFEAGSSLEESFVLEITGESNTDLNLDFSLYAKGSQIGG